MSREQQCSSPESVPVGNLWLLNKQITCCCSQLIPYSLPTGISRKYFSGKLRVEENISLENRDLKKIFLFSQGFEENISLGNRNLKKYSLPTVIWRNISLENQIHLSLLNQNTERAPIPSEQRVRERENKSGLVFSLQKLWCYWWCQWWWWTPRAREW